MAAEVPAQAAGPQRPAAEPPPEGKFVRFATWPKEVYNINAVSGQAAAGLRSSGGFTVSGSALQQGRARRPVRSGVRVQSPRRDLRSEVAPLLPVPPPGPDVPESRVVRLNISV